MYSQKKKRIGSTKPKIKNKSVKSTEAPTRKQDSLKNFELRKIFSKVGASENSTNDHNIYEIKDTKTISTNLKAQVTPEKNNADDISSCSHIPGLTDEDLEEIIKIKELEELFENTVDEFNIDFPTLPTPPVIHSSQGININCDSTLTPDLDFPILPSESIFHQCYDNPLDLSTIKVATPNSTFMPSNSSPIPLSSSLIPLNPAHKPNAHSAGFTQAHFTDKCSPSPSSTTTSYPTKTNNNIMGTTKAAGQENKRKHVAQLVMMPSAILEDILGLQGIKPTYELLTIGDASYFRPIYRYRVSFNDQQGVCYLNNLNSLPSAEIMGNGIALNLHNASRTTYFHTQRRPRVRITQKSLFQSSDYGSGTSMEDAKNSAARALLDKLTSNKFFGNVIGCLQELCMARHWPLPKYEQVLEIPTKKGRDFITYCTVLEYKEFGQGRNKKNAKLLAAYKMWMKINHRST